jgi:hypothetical protein
MDQAERERWHGKVVRYLGDTLVGPELFPDEGPEFVQIPKGGYGYYRWEYVDPAEGSSGAGRWNLVGPLKTREGSRKRYADRGQHIWLDNGHTTEDHFYTKQCAGCRFGQRLGGCLNVATAEDGSDLDLAIQGTCPHVTPGPPGSWDWPGVLTKLSDKVEPTSVRIEAAEAEAARLQGLVAASEIALHRAMAAENRFNLLQAAVAKAVADLPVWPNGALMYLSPAERAADGVREQLTKLLAAMSSGWDDKGAKGAEVKDAQ